jgi:hypothetical protein
MLIQKVTEGWYSMFLAFLILVSNISLAGDLGYRYDGQGQCVLQDRAGLNPGFIGECGDLTVLDPKSFADDAFEYKNLRGAKFDGMSLNGISFQDADLRGASFRNGHLEIAELSRAIFDEYTNFTEADLRAAFLTGASLGFTNFEKADLRGTHLASTNIGEAVTISALINDDTVLPKKWTPQDLVKSGAIYQRTRTQFIVLKNGRRSIYTKLSGQGTQNLESFIGAQLCFNGHSRIAWDIITDVADDDATTCDDVTIEENKIEFKKCSHEGENPFELSVPRCSK